MEDSGDFEIVDQKMTSVNAQPDSTSGTSLLTNIPPPTELPSFITYQAPHPPHPPQPSQPPQPPPSTCAERIPSHPSPISLPQNTSSKASPVTIQPLPPTRSHFRHHSYPISLNSPEVKANIFLNPPIPPTPPCLVIQQPLFVKPSLSGSVKETLTVLTDKAVVRPQHLHPYNISFVSDPSAPCYSSPPNALSSYSATEGASFQDGSPQSHTVDAESGFSSESPHGDGWMGWIKGTVQSVGHKVAEKAKSSMDTMITTLDPQMKDFINSGGDIDVIVASDKEVKISPVKEAFQKVFGKATVSGMGSQPSEMAAQPVGFEAVLKSAENRINCLRESGKIHPQQPVVAVEGVILELTPDYWVEMSLLLLDDPWHDIILQTYSQPIPLPQSFVEDLKKATPNTYPFRSSGFSKTVGQVASAHLNVHHTLWQETLTGIPRREFLLTAARVLAELYRSRLPNDVI